MNRELILEEKSIKYPIADYLAQYTGDIKFEKKIDAFYDRDFDLYFHVNGKDYVFEFKFARDNYTGNPDEIQRVFNDLIRLNTVSDNMECYFMMIGEKSKFIRNFKNLGKEPVNPNPNGPSIAPANKTVPTKINPYEEMFIFENDTTKDLKDGNGVEVKNAMDDKKAEKILVFDNSDIKPRIDAFKDEKGCHYKLSKEYNDIYGSIDKYFQQIKSLKTILFRCTKDVSDSSRTGIGVWKIERA